MKGLLWFLGVGGLIYGALMGWMYVNQRAMIYFPGTDMGAPQDVGLTDISVVSLPTDDGLILQAWYKAPEDAARVVVFFHGNGGTIAGRAGKVWPYLAAGYGVLMVEYRGYGGNAGTPDEAGLYLDADAALRFLREQGIAPDRWVLYGESLGSAVAIEAAFVQARTAPVGALVLEAPFTSLVDVAGYHYPYMPVRWLMKDRYQSAEKIKAVRAPVLVVHGSEDTTVPARFGRTLFAAATQPKEGIWIEGGAHNDLYDHGAAGQILQMLGRWKAD